MFSNFCTLDTIAEEHLSNPDKSMNERLLYTYSMGFKNKVKGEEEDSIGDEDGRVLLKSLGESAIIIIIISIFLCLSEYSEVVPIKMFLCPSLKSLQIQSILSGNLHISSNCVLQLTYCFASHRVHFGEGGDQECHNFIHREYNCGHILS